MGGPLRVETASDGERVPVVAPRVCTMSRFAGDTCLLVMKGSAVRIRSSAWHPPSFANPRPPAHPARVAAIALSYQSTAPQMKASFRRRFIGTVGGMVIGAAAWYLPGGTVMAVVAAVMAGWGFGIRIDGMGTADKSAFLAGLTALYPTDHPLFSLLARSAGLLVGFMVVVFVVTQVWPSDAPEERANVVGWPWRRRPDGST